MKTWINFMLQSIASLNHSSCPLPLKAYCSGESETDPTFSLTLLKQKEKKNSVLAIYCCITKGSTMECLRKRTSVISVSEAQESGSDLAGCPGSGPSRWPSN
jgi:hypothetical protein